MSRTFVMVDGLDLEFPKKVRLSIHLQGTLTRGFGGSPKLLHRPNEKWKFVNSPVPPNDDWGLDLERIEAWFDVGQIWVDTVNDPPEMIQITSLEYVSDQ